MQKKQVMIQLDPNVLAALSRTAERYGLTANQLIVAGAHELSRVRPENVWHALGRIAQGEGVEIMPPDVESLPAPRKAQRRALPATT
jgi:hypothetical protein